MEQQPQQPLPVFSDGSGRTGPLGGLELPFSGEMFCRLPQQPEPACCLPTHPWLACHSTWVEKFLRGF